MYSLKVAFYITTPQLAIFGPAPNWLQNEENG